jgi:hypothetical protein
MKRRGVGGYELTRWEAVQRMVLGVVCRMCGWSLRSGWRWTPFYFAYDLAMCRIITLNYAPISRAQDKLKADIEHALELLK